MVLFDRYRRTPLVPPSITGHYRRRRDDVETFRLVYSRALDLIDSPDVVAPANRVAAALAPRLVSRAETTPAVAAVLLHGAVGGFACARAEEATGAARPGLAHNGALLALTQLETATSLKIDWKVAYDGDSRLVVRHREYGSEAGYWLGRVGSVRLDELLDLLRIELLHDGDQYRL